MLFGLGAAAGKLDVKFWFKDLESPRNHSFLFHTFEIRLLIRLLCDSKSTNVSHVSFQHFSIPRFRIHKYQHVRLFDIRRLCTHHHLWQRVRTPPHIHVCGGVEGDEGSEGGFGGFSKLKKWMFLFSKRSSVHQRFKGFMWVLALQRFLFVVSCRNPCGSDLGLLAVLIRSISQDCGTSCQKNHVWSLSIQVQVKDWKCCRCKTHQQTRGNQST